MSEVARQPVIGITATTETDAQRGIPGEPASAVARSYIDAVVGAGGIPILLAPFEATSVEIERVLALVDGVVISGGLDVDPAHYGHAAHALTKPAARVRDEFELLIAREAIKNEVPLLGVCRGMQILNVARGGTLHQHLPDLVGHDSHVAPYDQELAADARRFNIELASDSLAARAVGETTTFGWSNHHQGVDALGEGLVASGWARDGVVVAIEDPSRAFALGVQWHPEVDPRSRVIAALIDATRTSTNGFVRERVLS